MFSLLGRQSMIHGRNQFLFQISLCRMKPITSPWQWREATYCSHSKVMPVLLTLDTKTAPQLSCSLLNSTTALWKEGCKRKAQKYGSNVKRCWFRRKCITQQLAVCMYCNTEWFGVDAGVKIANWNSHFVSYNVAELTYICTKAAFFTSLLIVLV